MEANLDAWVTPELLAHRETCLNLLPSATRYFITADAVVQQTEISSNTSIVFKDERIGDAQFLCLLGIIEQKFVQVAVSTVKWSQFIVRSQRNKLHKLPAPFNMLFCLCHCLLKLSASLGTLLRSSVLNLQPSPLEVEGIFALQYGGLSNRSCHNQCAFIGSTPQRYK